MADNILPPFGSLNPQKAATFVVIDDQLEAMVIGFATVTHVNWGGKGLIERLLGWRFLCELCRFGCGGRKLGLRGVRKQGSV